MTIDIISYTEDQLAALRLVQLAKVTRAQLKKNRLERKLEADMLKERNNLIENGTFNSALYEKIQEKLQQSYEEEVEAIRAELLSYLANSTTGKQEDANSVGYPVNYSYSYEQRFADVKSFYLYAYDNPQVRFDYFAADDVAKRYLGEYYAPLYDYFLALS